MDDANIGDKSERDTVAEILNSLLRSELAILEAYNKAVSGCFDAEIADVIERCRNAHAVRIVMLREQIEKLGGLPASTAGILGYVARLVESGAIMLGDKVAVSVLAEAEEFVSREYEGHLQSFDPEVSTISFDPETTSMVEGALYPDQCRSDRLITILAASVAA